MISKDLLHALQTRSKKLIRELDRFASDIGEYSLEDGWTVVAETIRLAAETAPSEPKYSQVTTAINRGWLAFAEQSETAANLLYDAIITALEKTCWTNPAEAQAGYQLLRAFHDNELRFPAENACLRLALRRHSPRLQALIEKIGEWSAQPLVQVPVRSDTGTGADLIDMLFEVYFYHTSYLDDRELRGEGVALLLPLTRRNPEIGNNLTLSLLENRADRAAIIGELIEIYLNTRIHSGLRGMFHNLMLNLLDNDGSSGVYEDLDEITAALEESSQRWSASQFETLAKFAFFYRFDTDDERRRLLLKSKKARRLAAMLTGGGHPGEHLCALRTLYQWAEQQPPGTTISMAGAHQFQDLNFKLMVIQELMYAQQTLSPQFDIDEFVSEYTDREIMIEDEGYALIPEALQYFEGLLIPAELLAQVEELSFDGGHEIYSQVFPFWDGECGTFDVKSIADVDLLPNLKCIASMPDTFVEQFGAALKKKSIALSD